MTAATASVQFILRVDVRLYWLYCSSSHILDMLVFSLLSIKSNTALFSTADSAASCGTIVCAGKALFKQMAKASAS